MHTFGLALSLMNAGLVDRYEAHHSIQVHSIEIHVVAPSDTPQDVPPSRMGVLADLSPDFKSREF